MKETYMSLTKCVSYTYKHTHAQILHDGTFYYKSITHKHITFLQLSYAIRL